MGCGPRAVRDETLMMTPPLSAIARAAATALDQTAFRLRSIWASHCDSLVRVRYRAVASGRLPALLTRTKADFKEHLRATRTSVTDKNDVACKQMVVAIKATTAAIPDKNRRKQWSLDLWKLAEGNEKYFGRWGRVATDPAVALLAHQGARGGHFLLTIQPKARLKKREIAPREVVFVVDNSVSMSDQQAALIASFPGFIQTIQNTLSATSDYHILVADTDDEGRCTAANCQSGALSADTLCDEAGGYACTIIII